MLFPKFPLKPLFDIVPDDTGRPILVWRESGKKIQVDIPQVNFRVVNIYYLRIYNVMKLVEK